MSLKNQYVTFIARFTIESVPLSIYWFIKHLNDSSSKVENYHNGEKVFAFFAKRWSETVEDRLDKTLDRLIDYLHKRSHAGICAWTEGRNRQKTYFPKQSKTRCNIFSCSKVNNDRFQRDIIFFYWAYNYQRKFDFS